jgi:PilZ domain
MQSLTEWFADVPTGDPALWLAGAAGLLVTLVLLLRGRRPGRPTVPVVLPKPAGSPDWESPPHARHDERRRSIRRAGLPSPIYLIDARPVKKARPLEAYVLDRSTGGLRLAVEQPVGVGSHLLARPSHAPADFEWVKLVVRNCREVGDYFELGCQFETELELSRMLMFG